MSSAQFNIGIKVNFKRIGTTLKGNILNPVHYQQLMYKMEGIAEWQFMTEQLYQ